MARKRGGIAGIWDRNKQIIKPVATTLAGIVGTPALGAAVGAAMGGLDRPGKSGVGLDVGGALKGGVSGYAGGKLGAGLKTGFKAGGGLIGGLKAAGKKALPTLLAGGGGGNDGGGGWELPSLGNVGDSIKNAVTGNGGMNALAFAQLMNAASLGKKSGELSDYALDSQKKLFADKEGLRSGGIAGMQAPRAALPQLGKLGAVGNPFGMQAPPSVAPGPPQGPPAPPVAPPIGGGVPGAPAGAGGGGPGPLKLRQLLNASKAGVI